MPSLSIIRVDHDEERTGRSTRQLSFSMTKQEETKKELQEPVPRFVIWSARFTLKDDLHSRSGFPKCDLNTFYRTLTNLRGRPQCPLGLWIVLILFVHHSGCFLPPSDSKSVCIYIYIYILDAILLALLIRSVQWHGINYLNSYTWFRLRFLLPFFSPSHLRKGILVSPHPTPTFPFCLAPSAFSFHGSPHNRCNKGVVEMLFRVRDRTRVPLPSYPAA